VCKDVPVEVSSASCDPAPRRRLPAGLAHACGEERAMCRDLASLCRRLVNAELIIASAANVRLSVERSPHHLAQRSSKNWISLPLVRIPSCHVGSSVSFDRTSSFIVTEPHGNRGDVALRLQQVHGRRVTKVCGETRLPRRVGHWLAREVARRTRPARCPMPLVRVTDRGSGGSSRGPDKPTSSP